MKHLLVILAIMLAACTSSDVIMTGDKRPATSPAAVKVYLRHPENFDSIALITATSNTTPSRIGNKERALNELKEKAAALGANGIVLTQADGGESPRPFIGSTTYGTTVGAAGSGKGPLVEMQAEAVFVR